MIVIKLLCKTVENYYFPNLDIYIQLPRQSIVETHLRL